MINRKTKLCDVLKASRRNERILWDAGMRCLGCPVAQEETLEEACRAHRIDVNELLKKLNA